MKNLEKKKGTIAWYLTKNCSSIYDLINKGNINGAREKVLELLDSPEIKDEKARVKAKSIFSQNLKANNFYGVLTTYMFGEKC